MFVRCETHPLAIGGKYLKVGDMTEVSAEVLAQLSSHIARGILSVHERDTTAARKARKDAKPPARQKPVRARDEDGEFTPDDKATRGVNEAWVGGEAPTNIRALRKSELVSLAKSLDLPLHGRETKTALIKQITEARGN